MGKIYSVNQSRILFSKEKGLIPKNNARLGKESRENRRN
jgi:hypothetical protein